MARIVGAIAAFGVALVATDSAIAADKDTLYMPSYGPSLIAGDVRVSVGAETDDDHWIDLGVRVALPIHDGWWLQPDIYLFNDDDDDSHFVGTAHIYKQITATKVAGLYTGFVSEPGDYSAFYVGAEAEGDIGSSQVLGGRVHVTFPDYDDGGWVQGAAWLTHYFHNDNARITAKVLGWKGLGSTDDGAELYVTAAKRFSGTTLDGFLEGSVGTNSGGDWAAGRVGVEYSFGIPGATMRQSKEAVRFQSLEWP